MSVSLYFDQHVLKAIRRGLRARQVDVITAQEDGTSDWNDERLLDRATELGRVLFTQDEDFLVIFAHRQASDIPFGGVIFAPQLGISNRQAIEDLELFAKTTEPSEAANQLLYFPL